MKVLRRGSKGPLVYQWQNFLYGLGHYKDRVVDSSFGPKMEKAVKAFQKTNKLTPVDGIIGNATWGQAMSLGLEVVVPATTGKEGPGWPKQGKLKPANLGSRQKMFGTFGFKPAPTKGNKEGIKITSRSSKFKIVKVNVPQLRGVRGAAKSGNTFFHAAVADQLVDLFQAWEDKGLISKVKTWGGSYVPRFIRGSRTSLSNHAWGTAFDINVPWNGLGKRPALVGDKGSVRELVKTAEAHGFFWGGFFSRRPDGMHFEAAKIL